MRESAEKILRNTCLVLCALVALQFVYAVFQACRLVGVKVPVVPTLAAGSNATVSASAKIEGPGTMPAGVSHVSANDLVSKAKQNNGAITNVAGSNAIPPAAKLAQAAKSAPAGSNSLPLTVTNPLSLAAGSSIPKAHRKHGPGPIMMVGGPGFGFGGPPSPPLPPVIKAQVDLIVNSEILGPAMHPLPMALLGIAGDTVFLRSADGQTGLVKEGDSLGDLKLLKIGINRVLVEQKGQKKELTIFDGYGGGSLLPKQDQKSP